MKTYSIDRFRVPSLDGFVFARIVLSLLVVWGLVISAAPPIAHAQGAGVDRSSLYIKTATISREVANNKPIYEGASASFSFTWDATEYFGTENAAQPGDFLKITLPKWGMFTVTSAPMKNAEGQTVAQCAQKKVDGTVSNPDYEVVCTFTDFVRDNPRKLKGGFDTTLYFRKVERFEPTTIEVGPVSVDLTTIATPEVINQGVPKGPTSGPVSKAQIDPKNFPLKEGIYYGNLHYGGGKSIIGWFVYVRGTGSDLVITDKLSAPQKRAAYINDPATWKESVHIRSRDKAAEGTAGGHWNLNTDSPSGTAVKMPVDDFNVEWSEVDGENQVKITIKNTTTDKFYRVAIYAEVPPSEHQPGQTVVNTAYVNGKDIKKVEVQARNVIKAYAEGEDGFGDVVIYKNVIGLTPKLQQAYTLNVTATIEKPKETEPGKFNDPEQRVLTLQRDSDGNLVSKLSKLPTGTKVHLVEVAPAPIDDYRLKTVTYGEGKAGTSGSPDDGSFTVLPNNKGVNLVVRNKATTEVGIRNIYESALGQFTVTKKVEGLERNLIPQSFKVHYRCTDSQDPPKVREGEFDVTPGEATLSPKLPEGMQCALSEPEDNTRVEGFTLASKTFVPDVVVPAKDPKTAQVTLTNVYERDKGGFKIHKRVDGDAEQLATKPFTFEYQCGTSTAWTRVDVARDATVPVPDVPTGVCRVREVPSPVANTTVNTVLSAGNAHASGTDAVEFTVTKDSAAAVTVEAVNTYTHNKGAFAVRKVVEGDGKEAVKDKEFVFLYKCHGDTEWKETAPVRAGESVTVTDIRVGGCELKEKPASHDGLSLDTSYQVGTQPVETGEVVRFNVASGAGAQVSIVATNTYTKHKGGFSVEKVVAGDYAAAAPNDFTFEYKCQGDADWKDLKVAKGATVLVNDVLVGECQIKEVPAPVADAHLMTTWAVNGNDITGAQPLTFNVTKDTAIAIKATNTYTRETGRLSIRKNVNGDAADMAPARFTFDISCQAGAVTRTVHVEPGKEVTEENLPTGACTVKEQAATVAGAQHTVGYTVNGAEVKPNAEGFIDINVQKDAAVEVVANNTYTRDRGSIELAKTVIVDGVKEKSVEKFAITATCDGMPPKQLDLVGDGTPVTIEGIPTGTNCTFAEADAARSGYTHGVKIEPSVATVNTKGEKVKVNVTNTYVRDTGGFSITKEVSGTAAVLAPKNFTFSYSCADNFQGEVTVQPGVPTLVNNVPTGECRVEEKVGGTNTEVPFATRDTTISVDGQPAVAGTSATFDVVAKAPKSVAVKVTNTYTAEEYPFWLIKNVSSDFNGALLKERGTAKDYIFDYTCKPAFEGAKATSGTVTVKGNGVAVESPLKYPVGTECTLVERAESATIAGFTHIEPQPVVVKVEPAGVGGTATVDNRYTRNVGEFELKKKVEGWSSFANDNFEFSYTCTHPDVATPQTGTLVVLGNGTPVAAGVKLPIGSECVITENVEKAKRFGFFLKDVPEIRLSITEENPRPVVEAVNSYIPWIPFLIPLIPLVVAPFIPQPVVEEERVLSKVPSTAPQTSGEPKAPANGIAQQEPAKKHLANTGVDSGFAVWILFGLLCMLAGSGLLRKRRS